MFKNNALKLALIFTLTFILLIGVYFASAYYQYKQSSTLLLAQVKNRVALDLGYLNLPEPFLNHAGSEEMVIDYIKKLNTLLGKNSAITLNAIENIPAGLASVDEFSETLQTPQRSIKLFFTASSRHVNWLDFYFVIAALIVAFITLNWWRYYQKQIPQLGNSVSNNVVTPTVRPLLLIDLQSKSIANNITPEKQVNLANKPLCFYLALIEFCIENPDVTLNQNKDVPEPLIELANKYFYRLIELGHTIRKRPNFTNSLEKTLSEIRAALDETLIDLPELKERYYPPKAHGEGSRSRLHSYGLSKITINDIEVIGK